jgi:hypothetical protein
MHRFYTTVDIHTAKTCYSISLCLTHHAVCPDFTPPCLPAAIGSSVAYRCPNVDNTNFNLTLTARTLQGECSISASGVAEVVFQSACYTVANNTRAFKSACEDKFTKVLEGSDDGAVNVTTPFPVSFYSTNYTYVGINANGFMTMGTVEGDWHGNACPLPNVETPEVDAIFAFWDDLETKNGVCYTTRGSSPNREFVVTWDRANQWSQNNQQVSFSIILKEGSRDVEVVYGELVGITGGSATIGVQKAARDKATTWSCNNRNIIPPGSNTALKYTWVS